MTREIRIWDGEVADEINRLSSLLDRALTAMRDRKRAEAVAERDYRKARAEAWLRHTDGSAMERKDAVEAATADARYERDLLRGDHQAAWEAVRNYRAQISAIQSLLRAQTAEAEFSRTGPQVQP